MKSIKTYNKYDVLIILFVALQATGLYGGAFQPLRILAILFIPFLLFGTKGTRLTHIYRYEINYFLLFFLWSIISLVLVIDIVEAVKEISYLCANFLLFVLMLLFSLKAINPKKSIITGWIIFCVILFPLSYIEIFHGFHLSSSVLEEDVVLGGTSDLFIYSSTTFGNYNYYVVLLASAFPFVTANIFIQKSTLVKVITLGLVLFLAYIVITNASRGGLLCMGIGFVYFFYKYFRANSTAFYGWLMIGIIGIVTFFTVKYADTVFFTLFYRLQSLGMEDNARAEIYSALWELLKDSLFMGVGPGNLQTALKQNSSVEIVAAHNLFLEILVQYGIFIFVGFLILILRIFLKIRQGDYVSKYVVILGLMLFPIASIINSTYLQGTNVWVFIVSLLIMTSDKKFLNT